LSFLSQEVTGLEPDARVAFLDHEHEALQQSQSEQLVRQQSFLLLAVQSAIGREQMKNTDSELSVRFRKPES